LKTGKVRWFDAKKGYGFITYVGEDVYVHYSQITEDGYRELQESEEVFFELVETTVGKQARNVVRTHKIIKK
jgi:CspA family cold shock protein